MAKKLGEFRGAIVPRQYGEIDYLGMQTSQCNSMDAEVCEDIDCKQCLYDQENIDIYRVYRERRQKKIAEKCPELLD